MAGTIGAAGKAKGAALFGCTGIVCGAYGGCGAACATCGARQGEVACCAGIVIWVGSGGADGIGALYDD
jgi:hypothetical protein